jgi:hypothetical protein
MNRARAFAERRFETQPAIALVAREEFVAWYVRGVVPEVLAVLQPPKPTVEPEPETEPVAPPRFPHLARTGCVVLSLVLLLGAEVLNSAYPSHGVDAAVLGAAGLLLAPVVFGVYRWRWYWWRRGAQLLWPGWVAPRWPGLSGIPVPGRRRRFDVLLPGEDPAGA